MVGCPPNPMRLSIEDHDRDSAQLVYVYPVLSRRAGGVSVGINLNPNNACNWRCVYCQVPDLVPGMAPDIDLARLESELAGFLRRVVHGDYLAKHVPEGMPEGSRVLKDVAFSGNGITINSVTRNSSTSITVRMSVAGTATASFRDVTVTNPDGGTSTLANGFRVT